MSASSRRFPANSDSARPDSREQELDKLCANTIRGLAVDAIQKANSGHPGLPLGMADVAFVLWTRFLRYDPACPDWPDRDRFVLSGGHGSALLYSLLHLSGIELTLDDLRAFRQLGSRTPGHPEHWLTPMVETTTGPLGQGFANAVGMAMAERLLREHFGEDLVNHHTYVMAGDGDLMEGIAAEAASLAGHLRLGRLVLLYDQNGITIDGSTDLTFTEDVPARFAAYGWHVLSADGHDKQQVAAAITLARADTRPSIICCRTTIGFGSPGMAGSNKVHGAPLGPAEIKRTKKELGLDPEKAFAVPSKVLRRFRDNDPARARERQAWEARLEASARAGEWRLWWGAAQEQLSGVLWPAFQAGTSIATRKASGQVLAALSNAIPNLVGGAADLAGSNQTYLPGKGDVSPMDFTGRNIHFGVREHSMAGICNGMALHGAIRPYCGTFLVFHDYMRPSVRLAAMMGLPVVFVYTHDSILVGEDGPTHQPVEQLQALRLVPGLVTLRPADANEVSQAWKIAMRRHDGLTAIVLTRQKLPVLDRTGLSSAGNLSRGGYVLSDRDGARAIIIATGSEVSLALQAQEELDADGIPVRVVNLASWELFQQQGREYRSSVLLDGLPRVSVEAGTTNGWERYVGLDGASVGIDDYGHSAPGDQVARFMGLSVENVVETVKNLIQ